MYTGDIITSRERKEIEAIPQKMELHRMEYFLVNVILSSLKGNDASKFKGFLKVLEDCDITMLTAAAKNLGM